MAFSRKKSLEDALATKIQRAIIMSKGQVNSDFDKNHPDWVRDAQSKNYTQLIKKVTEDHKQFIQNYRDRQVKKYGKRSK